MDIISPFPGTIILRRRSFVSFIAQQHQLSRFMNSWNNWMKIWKPLAYSSRLSSRQSPTANEKCVNHTFIAEVLHFMRSLDRILWTKNWKTTSLICTFKMLRYFFSYISFLKTVLTTASCVSNEYKNFHHNRFSIWLATCCCFHCYFVFISISSCSRLHPNVYTFRNTILTMTFARNDVFAAVKLSTLRLFTDSPTKSPLMGRLGSEWYVEYNGNALLRAFFQWRSPIESQVYGLQETLQFRWIAQ